MSMPYEFESDPWRGETQPGAEFGELTGGETEWETDPEQERGQWRPPRSSLPVRSKQPRSSPQRPVRLPPRRPPQRVPRSGMVGRAWDTAAGPEEPAVDQLAAGTEHGRWVQTSLNSVLGFRLPVTGVIDAATRSAVRTFQTQQGLPVDGIVGPPTETALADAYAGAIAPVTEAPEREMTFGPLPCGCRRPGQQGRHGKYNCRYGS